MIETIRLGLLLAVLALSIGYGASDAPRSYLAAIQRSASDPGVNQPKPPSHPQSPPAQRGSNTQRLNGRHHNGGNNRYGYHGGDGGCRNDYRFDYIMLTLQWGPGFCATSPQECVRQENKQFTIHGMWPQFYNAYSPTNCCFDNQFDFKSIQSLVPALNKKWFSYYSQNSERFWSHEWLKHGTCLRDVKQLQGEQKFFGTTLDIANKLPVLQTLAKAGITPGGPNNLYHIDNILDALKPLTGGKRAKVECDLEAHQPNPVLKGIDFCFDPDLKFTDCPASVRRCQKMLMFIN